METYIRRRMAIASKSARLWGQGTHQGDYRSGMVFMAQEILRWIQKEKGKRNL